MSSINKQQLKTLGITTAFYCDNILVFFDNISGLLLSFDLSNNEVTFLCKIIESSQPYIFKIIKYENSIFLFDKLRARVYEYKSGELVCHHYDYNSGFSDFFENNDYVIMTPLLTGDKMGIFSLKNKEFEFFDLNIIGLDSHLLNKEIVYPFLAPQNILMPIGNTNAIISYQNDSGLTKVIKLNNDAKISTCGYEPNTESLVVSEMAKTELIYYDIENQTIRDKWNAGQCSASYYSRFLCAHEFTIGLPGKDSDEIILINNNTKEKKAINISGYISDNQRTRNVSKVIFAIEYSKGRVVLFPHNFGGLLFMNLDDFSLEYQEIYVDCRVIWKNARENIFLEDGECFSLDNFVGFIKG